MICDHLWSFMKPGTRNVNACICDGTDFLSERLGATYVAPLGSALLIPDLSDESSYRRKIANSHFRFPVPRMTINQIIINDHLWSCVKPVWYKTELGNVERISTKKPSHGTCHHSEGMGKMETVPKSSRRGDFALRNPWKSWIRVQPSTS